MVTDCTGLGRNLADELFPAAMAALTKPLPADWDDLARAAYAFRVVGVLYAAVQRERDDRALEGMSEAAADIYAYGAHLRIMERMTAVGLAVPLRMGEKIDAPR